MSEIEVTPRPVPLRFKTGEPVEDRAGLAVLAAVALLVDRRGADHAVLPEPS